MDTLAREGLEFLQQLYLMFLGWLIVHLGSPPIQLSRVFRRVACYPAETVMTSRQGDGLEVFYSPEALAKSNRLHARHRATVRAAVVMLCLVFAIFLYGAKHGGPMISAIVLGAGVAALYFLRANRGPIFTPGARISADRNGIVRQLPDSTLESGEWADVADCEAELIFRDGSSVQLRLLDSALLRPETIEQLLATGGEYTRAALERYRYLRRVVKRSGFLVIMAVAMFVAPFVSMALFLATTDFSAVSDERWQEASGIAAWAHRLAIVPLVACMAYHYFSKRHASSRWPSVTAGSTSIKS